MPRLLGRTPQATKSSSNIRLPPPEQSMIEGDALFNPDAVDVIIEVVKCFGVMLSPYDEIQALQEVIITLLDNKKATSAVRKKAVIALSILAVYLLDEQLVAFLDRAVTVLKDSKSDPVTQRLYLTIMGSMARSIPYRFGKYIGNVVQLTLAFLAEEDLQSHLEEMGEGDDVGLEFAEVREAALVALEAFLASCPSEMRPYTDNTIAACLRYLKYDPNYAMDDDEDMEEEEEEEDDDFGDDDEFEAGGAFDDDDDASWKVRRCAAKALHTLVSTRSNGDLLDNGVLYGQVAPPLVKRFDEREDNVRLEVISALSVLIRKTGEGIIPEFMLDSSLTDGQSQQPQSRKRRRQSSVVSASARFDGSGLVSPITEKIPTTGPRADLAKLTQQIVKSSTKLLKGKSIPTKQATMNLLDDLILVQQGGLSDYLDQIIDLIIDAVKTTAASSASTSLSGSGGAASATPATLRVAALKFLGDIAKTHSSSLLQPHLSKIVSGVVGAVNDRFYKISSQAIVTVEEIGKAITPPRSRMTAQKYKPELSELYDVIVEKASAVDADTEVRQKAIHALGTLLARTSGDAEGASLLSSDRRDKGLSIIADRLKNETTRLAAVRAIEEISAHPAASFDTEWVRGVTLELSAQVRKANRALRGSSIQALKHLSLSPAGQEALDQKTTQILVEALLPIITNADSHLHGSTFRILASLVKVDPSGVVTASFNTAICEFVQQNVVAAVMDPLLDLVAQIGQSGVGEDLMTRLLKDVGVGGDPSTVGKVIGTLLVASGGTGGVNINSFITEAETAEDKARGSLALSVLGEAALRLGVESPLKPEIFTKHFGDEYDKFSLTAALALGRAAAGNVDAYLPVILQSFEDAGTKQYLLLQSIKEILLQSVDFTKFAQPIWDCLLASSQVEDNKAVSAECIGRLAIVDPEAYIPKLDVCF